MSVCLDSDIHNIGCREINKLSFLTQETGDLCMNNHFIIAQLSRTYKGNVCVCVCLGGGPPLAYTLSSVSSRRNVYISTPVSFFIVQFCC